MAKHVGQIIACYFGGIAVGSIIAAAYFKAPEIFFFVLLAASLLGIPFLVLAICIFFVFRTNVRDHLPVWCAANPFIVLLLVIAVEWATLAPHVDPSKYFIMRPTLETYGITFACASGSAFLFWFLNRKSSVTR